MTISKTDPHKPLFLGIFILLLAYLGFPFHIDPDLWWHLKAGEYIVSHGIPAVDIFSYTVLGKSWTTHEWLSEVLLWICYSTGKLPLVMGFFAILAVVIFSLVYSRCAGKPFLAALLTILACSACSFLWGPRPQFFNTLMLALLLLILEKVRNQEGSRKILYIFPLLFIVWANLHSGFVLGILVLGIYWIGDQFQSKWTGQATGIFSSNASKHLLIIMFLSAACAAVNPHGFNLFIYPFHTLMSQPMQNNLMDWQSPNFHFPELWPFLVFLVTTFLSFMVRRNSLPNFSETLLFLGFFVASMVSVRHIPFFVIAATPLAAQNFTSAQGSAKIFLERVFISKKLFAQTAGVFLFFLVIGLFVSDIKYKIDHYPDQEIRDYPSRAVDFLEKKDLTQKRIFNHYTWGGYLIWRGIPVFVDGRADVYGNEFLERYFQACKDPRVLDALLDEYKIDLILIPPYGPNVISLSQSPSWKEVFHDGFSVLYARA
jgi:hypothetical protein